MANQQKTNSDRSKFVYISRFVEAPYNYCAGRYVSKYLTALKDQKQILGVKCPKCGRVYAPPRAVCGPCFVQPDQFVPVSDKGTIMAFTVTKVPYTNPNTGEPKKLPFTAAYIRLDGSDSNIMHCLDETDETKLKTGMRVQAVFSDHRTGDHFTDIVHFRVLPNESRD